VTTVEKLANVKKVVADYTVENINIDNPGCFGNPIHVLVNNQLAGYNVVDDTQCAYAHRDEVVNSEAI